MSDPVRLVALIAAVGVLAAHTAGVQPWTVDDAFIAFRYADHWAQGWGPVYNPGETVEGFTSLGWVAALAMAAAAGVPLEPAAKLLGVGAAVAMLVGLAAMRPARAAAIAVLLAGTSAPLCVWAAAGMEVAPAAAVVLAVLALAWRLLDAPAPGAALRLGLAIAGATVVRPEAALLAPAVAVALVARKQAREAGLVIAGAVAGYAPVEVWRLWTYGWPLPNTAYAKVGTTSAQVVRGLEALWAAAPAFVPLLLLSLTGLATQRRRTTLVLVWALLHVAFFVAVGGDALPGHRLLVPLVAPLAACAGWGLAGWEQRATWLAVPVVAAQLAVGVTDPELTARIDEGNVGRNGREVGLWLRETYGPDAVIATNTAGSVAWFSGLVTIDMFGLCDAHIAHRDMPEMGERKAGHEKADGAYVLSRRPDVVLFGAARGRQRPFFLSDQELWALPGFRAAYRYEEHTLPSGATVRLYRRTPEE